MMVFAMQLLSGENLIGQGVQFLEDAGLSEIAAFDLNMVLNSVRFTLDAQFFLLLSFDKDVHHWNHLFLGM